MGERLDGTVALVTGTSSGAGAGGPRQAADLGNVSSVAGRVARSGCGVYNLTRHGLGAFSEALRQPG